MATRFRLAVSYKGHDDPTVRPPLAPWLNPDRDMSSATYSQRVSYAYWTKIYWATPPWITEEQIAEMAAIYEAANNADSDNPQHVDHIVPLKNPLVCGLHVPWNLQILPEKENLHKSNKWWPDHPFEIVDLFAGLAEPHQCVLV